jgi:hypothetical protein
MSYEPAYSVVLFGLFNNVFPAIENVHYRKKWTEKDGELKRIGVEAAFLYLEILQRISFTGTERHNKTVSVPSVFYETQN